MRTRENVGVDAVNACLYGEAEHGERLIEIPRPAEDAGTSELHRAIAEPLHIASAKKYVPADRLLKSIFYDGAEMRRAERCEHPELSRWSVQVAKRRKDDPFDLNAFHAIAQAPGFHNAARMVVSNALTLS